jgi:undecaprenyl pyrophosphate phosphatase UppP
MHFLMATVMAAVFGYFCVSSFLRARRKERAR